ncbi:MAG: hypothetical protein DSM107014_15780 [Gomphosphaeria aponina SAG 52.96 = DSM 107014]|uniref:DZANK-type domain-containing protein n=1 Tax=Gomphosphaeria aponina SAG 52.96 = DSM 107014 TaxID=1521640 RepID=A0A941JQQ2_9CHRO|nr:hypothetical protein [Gomphosphaeria aponina SAG 52.96 = DSM 107014]
MATCPRCHQPIDAQAINCPHCHLEKKAFGHPGIPLHRVTEDTSLCNTCTYHADDTCNFPQRPYATTCILYQDQNQPTKTKFTYKLSPVTAFKAWCLRYQSLLFLLGLILISLLLAF